MNKLEIDALFYQWLKADNSLVSELKGSIYNANRVDGRDTEECIVVITNSVEHESSTEDSGYTNINVHCPDLLAQIDGTEQLQPDVIRLSELTELVLVAIGTHRTNFSIERITESVFAETTRAEHYNNIRVEWKMYKN
jgi:hypothetical protein